MLKEERESAALGAFIFFIPCFMKVKTEFVTFYMKQNFGIWIIYIVLGILLQFFMGVLSIIPMLFFFINIFFILFSILNIGILVFLIFTIFKAYKGERFEIPYVYEYTNKLVSKVPLLQELFKVK